LADVDFVSGIGHGFSFDHFFGQFLLDQRSLNGGRIDHAAAFPSQHDLVVFLRFGNDTALRVPPLLHAVEQL
jgi:hypothetical protein